MMDNGVYMRCQKDRYNKALKPREAICSMHGVLSDVEFATKQLIERLSCYYESFNESYDDHSMAVLIPQQYVTKIIGAGGCLIKEIVNRTGANIRVCSRKDDAQTDEIVVTVDGNKD
jgi:predicted PilT family ATPase